MSELDISAGQGKTGEFEGTPLGAGHQTEEALTVFGEVSSRVSQYRLLIVST